MKEPCSMAFHIYIFVFREGRGRRWEKKLPVGYGSIEMIINGKF